MLPSGTNWHNQSKFNQVLTKIYDRPSTNFPMHAKWIGDRELSRPIKPLNSSACNCFNGLNSPNPQTPPHRCLFNEYRAQKLKTSQAQIHSRPSLLSLYTLIQVERLRFPQAMQSSTTSPDRQPNQFILTPVPEPD